MRWRLIGWFDFFSDCIGIKRKDYIFLFLAADSSRSLMLKHKHTHTHTYIYIVYPNRGQYHDPLLTQASLLCSALLSPFSSVLSCYLLMLPLNHLSFSHHHSGHHVLAILIKKIHSLRLLCTVLIKKMIIKGTCFLNQLHYFISKSMTLSPLLL